MARAPEFFRQINEQLLEQLEEYARQPGRKGDEVLAWLEARDVKTSKSAVYRWLQDFRMEDDSRRTAAMARARLATVAEGDSQAVSEASMRLLEDRVLGVLADGEPLSAKELQALSFTIGNGVKSRRLLIDLRDQVRELETKLKNASDQVDEAFKGKVRPEDIAAARKAIFGS
jgi:ribonuclease D